MTIVATLLDTRVRSIPPDATGQETMFASRASRTSSILASKDDTFLGQRLDQVLDHFGIYMIYLGMILEHIFLENCWTFFGVSVFGRKGFK